MLYNGIEILTQIELENGMIEIRGTNGGIYIVYPEELNG